jgi:hypothetical protein
MLQSVDLAVQLVLRLSMSPMRSAYAQQRRSLSQLARRWVAATLMMPRSLSVVVPDRHEAMRACVMRVTAVCLADHPATQIAPVSEEESDADEEDDGVKISTGREDRMAAPVVKLSYKLIETYNHINEVYYTKQKEKKKWDDKNSDYIIKAGDVVGNGRYRLKKVIGSGSFGQVVSAIDTHAPGLCDACALPGDAKGLVAGISDYPQHPTGRCEVAIKIIKNKPAFHRQAKIEIELLTLLNGLQSNSRFDPNLVRMLAHFEHRDHIWYERAVESSRV